MHALIIEDEFLVALEIEDTLRDLGFTSFDWATTENGAIHFADVRHPDLITADVELSPGNGIEAVLKINETRKVPVVFVTGRPEAVTAIAGATVVSKPFGKVQLGQACLKCISPQDLS